MKELESYRKVMDRLPDGISHAEAEAEKRRILCTEIVNGERGAMECSEQTELFVRAGGKKTGMVYTQKLEEDPLEVIKKAADNSLCSQAEHAEEMADRSSVLTEDGRGGVREEQIKELSFPELTACAMELYQGLKAWKRETDSIRLLYSQIVEVNGLVNSKGVDISSAAIRYKAEVSIGSYQGILSAEDPAKLTASWFREDEKESGKGSEEQELLQAEPGIYRAVLSSEAVNNILITAWQMFSARRAQLGSTPLAGKEETAVFSPCITIRNQKGPSGEPALCGFSREIDCEGVPCRDQLLVDHGILKGWMHNLTSAREAGVNSTGNAGRKALLSGNIHTDMTIIPQNFVLEEGEASLQELWQACGDGIYIYENFDMFHALNIASGDFAFPCKGIRIRDGKPAGLVAGLTMNGNLTELFSCVELLGKHRRTEPLVMYDSYTVSGPAMLVSKLKITG